LDTLDNVLELALTDPEKIWFETAKEKRLELKEIKRYHNYNPMFYRTDVYMHGIRVAMLIQELAIRIQRAFHFDLQKAILMALIHDYPELITGDISAGNKTKMSEEQLRVQKESETKAAIALAHLLPKQLGDHRYIDLLEEVSSKKFIEAKIVDLCDKLDAMGESFHEIFAGNIAFVTNVVNGFGKIKTPPEHYWEYFHKISKLHPALAVLFPDHIPFLPIAKEDWKNLAQGRKPHTVESLVHLAGHRAYDFWKLTLLKRDPERQLRLLTTKVE